MFCLLVLVCEVWSCKSRFTPPPAVIQHIKLVNTFFSKSICSLFSPFLFLLLCSCKCLFVAYLGTAGWDSVSAEHIVPCLFHFVSFLDKVLDIFFIAPKFLTFDESIRFDYDKLNLFLIILSNITYLRCSKLPV